MNYLKTDSFILEIKNNRTEIMGIAIISVLIYHAFCWIYNPIGAFNIGYHHCQEVRETIKTHQIGNAGKGNTWKTCNLTLIKLQKHSHTRQKRNE